MFTQNSSDDAHPPNPTFPALIPYAPPKLEQTFYPNTDSQTTEHSNKVVDVPVVTRLYSDLESRYSEEPFSNVNPDNTEVDVYGVPIVVNSWVVANERSNNIKGHENSRHSMKNNHHVHGESVTESSQSKQVSKRMLRRK